jgi:hypothetical protein
MERLLPADATGKFELLKGFEGDSGTDAGGWGATPFATAERRLRGGSVLERGCTS